VPAITADAIKELAVFRREGSPVVTCYLDVDGRRYPRPVDYEVELDAMLREAEERADGAQVAADLERISEHVRAGLDRTRTRGLAIFSGGDELWQVVELPVPVANRLVVNAAPAVSQLEVVAQEGVRVGVLLVDKQRARVLVYSLGELVRAEEVVDELPRAVDTLGHRDQGDPSHHAEALVAQHVRRAAREAFEVFQDTGVRDVLLGGPDRLVAAVERDLHPYVTERVRGRLHLPIDAPGEALREEVMAMEHDIAMAREAAVVERLRAAVGAGAKGVMGLADTLAALVDQRAETLVVSHGYREGGWRCPACATLATVGRTCPRCGGEMAHTEDVVEEAVHAAYGQGCSVHVVEGSADLDVMGRIGAVLRF
jgi:peptide subunit release factor 1 (eRF1)